MITKKQFVINTFVLMFILSAILRNVFVAGIITLILSLFFYVVSVRKFNNKRIDLLEEECDPIAFLQETEKMKKALGEKSKDTLILEIDRAAALLLMGEVKMAKGILLSIKDRLPHRNIIATIYYINLISVYYQLNEIKEAEELYISEKDNFYLNQYTQIAATALEGERCMALKNYEEGKRIFNEVLNGNRNLTKRVRISILYNLAQIEEVEGNINSAMEKYKEVAESGNKLYIAACAKGKLDMWNKK